VWGGGGGGGQHTRVANSLLISLESGSTAWTSGLHVLSVRFDFATSPRFSVVVTAQERSPKRVYRADFASILARIAASSFVQDADQEPL